MVYFTHTGKTQGFGRMNLLENLELNAPNFCSEARFNQSSHTGWGLPAIPCGSSKIQWERIRITQKSRPGFCPSFLLFGAFSFLPKQSHQMSKFTDFQDGLAKRKRSNLCVGTLTPRWVIAVYWEASFLCLSQYLESQVFEAGSDDFSATSYIKLLLRETPTIPILSGDAGKGDIKGI